MLVIKSSSELLNLISGIKKNKDTIAFVPTMGNLHEGHLNLVSIAHQYGAVVIVSIFVNPLQFNLAEDLNEYPRTLEKDIIHCEDNDVDILFVPSDNDIYPQSGEGQRINLPELSTLSNILEGASRPNHFSGVVTVVKKLFELVRPDYVIFGEKDFQQLLIIKKMIEILDLPIRIISSKTIRETDGLAKSSRNSKLSSNERQLAINLYKVLKSIREQIISGNNNFIELTNDGTITLSESGFGPDYLVVRDCVDLRQASVKNNNDRIILIAAWLGKTRLIDNLRL
ncbi:MAG: pantoate--beta-alanine ligase [Thiohalomonadales bacterium]